MDIISGVDLWVAIRSAVHCWPVEIDIWIPKYLDVDMYPYMGHIGLVYRGYLDTEIHVKSLWRSEISICDFGAVDGRTSTKLEVGFPDRFYIWVQIHPVYLYATVYGYTKANMKMISRS